MLATRELGDPCHAIFSLKTQAVSIGPRHTIWLGLVECGNGQVCVVSPGFPCSLMLLKIETKQREEAEARRREIEAHEQEVAAKREARDRQVASTRALPLEPPQGTPGTATIRFRLPTTAPSPPSYDHLSLEEKEQMPVLNGMITRRFKGTDCLRDLKNFMESLGYSVEDFKLLTTYPRFDVSSVVPVGSIQMGE